jgi:hypothetical protein
MIGTSIYTYRFSGIWISWRTCIKVAKAQVQPLHRQASANIGEWQRYTLMYGYIFLAAFRSVRAQLMFFTINSM